ncbi:MAG: helix-turn-helix transcriptional regulator [Candidatus Omnitrophica bacterium]|nr:helix-turn-helix transcriptional regulator [Candidatus Omnitrophota bacterium]
MKISTLGLTEHNILSYLSETIRKNIRTAMREKGISNAELAENMCVSKQAVGKWLATGRMSLDRLEAIARFFNKHPGWFFDSEPNNNTVYSGLGVSNQTDMAGSIIDSMLMGFGDESNINREKFVKTFVEFYESALRKPTEDVDKKHITNIVRLIKTA